MANRYGREDYQQRGRGYRRSEYGPEPGSERFGNSRYGSSRFGSGEFRGDDREENYFGSGRQSYGEGYAGGSTYRDDTYPRDYEGGYGSYESQRRTVDADRTYGGSYQSDYERGYGDDRQIRNTGGYTGQTRYGDSTYGRSEYGAGYPESESGFGNRGRRGEGRERGWWDRASDEVSSWFGDREAERRRQMDERREGNYRGKGPKNYTRSDDRITEDINDRLTDYAYIDASDIDVKVNNSEVVLSGTVDSRYDKRLAESIAEDVTGVRNVENHIRVNRDYSTTGDWSYSDTAGHNETSSGTSNIGASTTGSTSRSKTAGR
ncbi:MAG TPA: BON domain-containing protein [Pyrinomonadaceae bacterium]|nr:BON domain-containing protein [Pyrinomonadaceae bacterium]